MPINVFGNSSSSHDSGNKILSSLFVQKLYLRTNYIDAKNEEDIDLKNQKKLKVYQILLAYEILVVKIMLITYSTILV